MISPCRHPDGCRNPNPNPTTQGKTASNGAAMSVALSRSGRVTYVGFEKVSK